MPPSDAKYFVKEEERELLLPDSDDEYEVIREPEESPNNVHVGEYPPPSDPRFTEPTPAPWKRTALIAFILFLFWSAYKLQATTHKPKVVHTDRYVPSLGSAKA